MESTFAKRQNYDDGDGDSGYNSWWFSGTGMVVRYSIAGVIAVLVLGFLLGGYWHAQRRLRKGQEPLAYHRWLVSNGTRVRNGREPIYPNGYGGPLQYRSGNNAYRGEQFNMNNWNYAPPPPAYNVPHNPPPEYYSAPPAGAMPSKEAEHSAYAAPAERENYQYPQSGPAYGAPPQAPGPVYGSGVYR